MQQALPEISSVKDEIKSIAEALLKLAVTPERGFDHKLLSNICGDLGLIMRTEDSGCVSIENGEQNSTDKIRLLPTSQLPNPTAIGLGTLAALKSIRPGASGTRMLLPGGKPMAPSNAGEAGKNLFYGTDDGLYVGRVSVASGMVFPASLKFTLAITTRMTGNLEDNSIPMMARLINGLGQSLSRQNDALAPVKIAYTSINSDNNRVIVGGTAFILQQDAGRVQKFLETYADNFADLYNVPCRLQVIATRRGVHTDVRFSRALRQSVSEIHASGSTELNEYFVLPLEHFCYTSAPCALVLVGAGTDGAETRAVQNHLNADCLRSGIEALTWCCLNSSVPESPLT